MSECKVHNVRFYKPEPRAIYCMTFNKHLKKLAVSRSDATIEIWSIDHFPFIERIISPTTENYSIEGLAWSENRLFSVGLHGLLIEYDLKKLDILNKASVTGQSAFCLDINKTNTHVAVGTEQGYINIFTLNSDGAVFDKFLDKQEGRILCLKYDPSGQFIVSGSLDVVRVWDVSTGHALHKMSTGRSDKNKPTIVWCLSFTADLTIISGDSRGKLTFWDGKIGAQIESYQSHRADVLAVCLSEDEQVLNCAGIDSVIMSYVRVQVKGANYKWVKSIQRKIHDHDVRALSLSNGKLYSGGVDGYLACSYHPPKTLNKYPPILQSSCVQVANKARFVLLKYPAHLELWSLKSDAEISIQAQSKKLLVLQRLTNGDMEEEKKEAILCSAISADGAWITFSTHSTFRLFEFKYKIDEDPQLTPIEDLPSECGAALNLAFTPNGKQLIVALKDGRFLILGLKAEVVLLQTIETSTYFNDFISTLLFSPCGQFLCAADCDSNIAVWKNIEQSWKFHCKLPKYNCPVTVIGIQPKTMHTVVIYSDHKFIEFDLYERKMTPFSKQLDDSILKFTKNYAIRNVTFDPRNDNVVILHDDANIFIIDKDKKTGTGSSVKIAKYDAGVDGDRSSHLIHSIKKYKHLVHLGWISNDEMIAVEVSPLALLEQLPPGFKQNTFGTK